MATYDGYTFFERGQSGTRNPQHGGAAQINARVSPSSDVTIDAGGSAIVPFDLPIQCGSATLVDLMNDIGASQSLVYSGGTVQAFLAEVKDCMEVKPSANVYWATLSFLVYNTSDVTLQQPRPQVSFGGTAYDTTALEVTVSHGTEQSSGQAMVVFPSRPAAASEGASVSISLSLTSRFSGTVTGRQWEHFPTGVAVDCRDRMEYLSYPYGGTERVYTSYTGGSITQNIAEAQGIDSTNMSIEDDGATVGVIEPVVFRRGDTFLPWIRQNDNISGYVTFTKGADSAIYRRPYDESTTGAGTHTLTKGVNLLSARREISRDGIYNAVQVDGLTYLGATTSVYMATANTDIRTPPGTISGHVQSNLIETPARASAVGSVFLDHNNFKPESFVFTVPGTAIEPMDMVVVTHSDLELSSRSLVVTKVEDRLSGSGYVTTVYAKRVTL